ncbi:MAG TPA: MBL fold metallo-hydrolase [Desulfobacteraceae bacterium]|nr:MBL fold metallo-hydrolase [Deltaproteobacteria bacterium]RLB99173.1 MAG: MBL fold metallo-hydrolase [Deltaproteobacteria bacterium]HDI60012.1 MBL fold metallo-hydrolase [Desulfobacteraceae bacterium]
MTEPLVPPPNGDGLHFCVLASGSKGNAVYVSDGETTILIDAGLSGVEIERRLRSRCLDPARIDAIVVSHEHTDHIRGVGVLARRYRLPVYLTRGTQTNGATALGRIDNLVHFQPGRAFAIHTLHLHPFALPHDAADPSGFTIEGNGSKLGIATDLGIAPAMIRTHLADCGALVLEANHDPRMLMEGPYPWPLKQRIAGRTGHLSNPEARDLLGRVRHDGLRHVVLAHLSEINNTPECALNIVAEGLGPCRARLTVALQGQPTELIELSMSSPRVTRGGRI